MSFTTAAYLTTDLANGNETSSSTGNGTLLSAGEEIVYYSRAEYLASILVPVFFGIIFCVGVLGNSLVITVMTKMYRHPPQGLNNTNRFILNLAISDLFFLVFCVPFQAPIYSTKGWPFGGFMCIFCEFCQKITMLASVYTLAALSFDRFLAVVYATSAIQLRTRSNANRGLIFIWVASIGIAIPATLTRVQVEYEGSLLCVPNWRMIAWYKWYQLVIFILGYVVPLLIILSCYVGVLYAMCQNARSSAVVRSKSAKGSRKRVTRIVIMVVVVFAIDWFPHHLTTLWINFGQFPFTSATFVLKLFSHCLSYANSCVNPLIYAFVSNRFRADFKKAFTCQYISDAVGSMKAYSRRFVRSLTVPLRSSQSGPSKSDSDLKPRPPIVSATSFRLNNKDGDDQSLPLKRQGSEITNMTVIQANTFNEPSPKQNRFRKGSENGRDGQTSEGTAKNCGIGYSDLNSNVTALIHDGIAAKKTLCFTYSADTKYDDVSDDDIFEHDKDSDREKGERVEMLVRSSNGASEQNII